MRFAVAKQQGLDETKVEQIDDGHAESGLPHRLKLALAFADAFFAAGGPPPVALQEALVGLANARPELRRPDRDHVAADTLKNVVLMLTAPDGTVHRFEIDPFAKRSLLEGLDELAFTMTHEEDIAAFERRFGRDNF